MKFSEFKLKNGLLKSLKHAGYEEATPIQAKVLKLALDGHNIVGQSQTGTGKTAAFLLPVLNQIDTNEKRLQALILAPTRELAVQIGDEIQNLTKYYGIRYTCLYGGASPFHQKKSLAKTPSIVIATPGRLMDFIQQKVIDVRVLDFFILDEVDRMLDMGFVRDITKIWKSIKNLKQTFTFSATMNPEMKEIITNQIHDYKFIKVGEEVTVDKIDHTYMKVRHEDKFINVIKLLRAHKGEKTIIFTHTKRNTDTIHKILQGEGFSIDMLNGDMSQNKRLKALQGFRDGKVQILSTTDVAARGLNMDNVGLVINMEVPSDVKSYIHRIGRTGRAGASGKAIMLTSHPEMKLLQDIEKHHAIKIKESEHIAIFDDNSEYSNIKLNKSTDKPGGRRGGGGGRGKGKGGRGGKRQRKGGSRRSGKKPGGNRQSNNPSRAGRKGAGGTRSGRSNASNSRLQRGGRGNRGRR